MWGRGAGGGVIVGNGKHSLALSQVVVCLHLGRDLRNLRLMLLCCLSWLLYRLFFWHIERVSVGENWVRTCLLPHQLLSFFWVEPSPHVRAKSEHLLHRDFLKASANRDIAIFPACSPLSLLTVEVVDCGSCFVVTWRNGTGVQVILFLELIKEFHTHDVHVLAGKADHLCCDFVIAQFEVFTEPRVASR